MLKAYAMIPLYLLVPVMYWLGFRQAGYPMHWGGFIIGMAGWWLAYVLRLPIVLALKKRVSDGDQGPIVYFSGPLEEGVRAAALVIFGTSLHFALSVGQGWAAIEVVFAIVNVVAIASLKLRTDAKAMQAKAVLEKTGIPTDGNPLWGVVERVFASAFHLGSTLIIAWNPWLAILMAPLHSAFNLSMLRFAKKSIPLAESFAACVGTLALIIGFVMKLAG